MNHAKVLKNIYVYFRMVSAALLFAAVVWLVAGGWGVYPLHFRYETYALLPLAAAIVNIVVGILSSRRELNDKSMLWFNMFIITVIFWAVGEFFQRVSADPVTFSFWEHATSLAWVFVGATYLIFTILYTDTIFLRLFDIAIIFSPSIVFIFINFYTDFVFHSDSSFIKEYFWGYDYILGPGFKYFLFIILAQFLISIVLLLIHYKRQHKSLERHQIRLFILATVIPVISGAFIDGLLPILGIQAPPVAILETSITGAILIYAMLKYKLFLLNPATVASNILQTMAEAVLVTDKTLHIEFVNHRAANLLNVEREGIIGEPIQTLFKDKSVFSEIQQELELLSTHGEKQFFDIDRVIMKNIGRKSTILTRLTVGLIADEREGVAGYVFVFADLGAIEQTNKSLEEKLAEIEKLNSLMIGRELKMIELKKELRELRGE